MIFVCVLLWWRSKTPSNEWTRFFIILVWTVLKNLTTMDLRSQTPLGHRASTERRIQHSRPGIESSAINSDLEEESFLNRPITHAPPPLNSLKSPRILTALYEKWVEVTIVIGFGGALPVFVNQTLRCWYHLPDNCNAISISTIHRNAIGQVRGTLGFCYWAFTGYDPPAPSCR